MPWTFMGSTTVYWREWVPTWLQKYIAAFLLLFIIRLDSWKDGYPNVEVKWSDYHGTPRRKD